ncbi:chemotaxis response regulator protein-glutamate methylesterase [Pelagicoccus sp. SDUM812003]|uniref:protein-glutamate methylesterase/protein-glutamine glutaminase n=1 Tax=Pelagicoccus sp. SDUM812003 TaxID=3041267 RepID=UPI00280E7452|nr:chemotaxis response regulator protein-glutamate methylesterase [Pelagicoccus sp. SDUM812003]MDQ8204710.1 chemotaxis response regulator protein-glutamate methylesterase [Pelagicoccus sp. SDUM812003]
MPIPRKIRAIVADDSTLTRRAICRLLESDPQIEVVAIARDGADAVNMAREYRPDVITLDINMPRLDGLSALKQILTEGYCQAIVVSTHTPRNADATIEALSLGAFDCVAKPDGDDSRDLQAIAHELIEKIKAAAQADLKQQSDDASARKPEAIFEPDFSAEQEPIDRGTPAPTRAIAIGISTGGPTSIQKVLPRFPADLDAAIFLVQHMPANFTSSFSKRLASKCSIQVEEARARQSIRSGVCYVGQGGRHMVPHRRSDSSITMRCPTQPQSLFVPSVDVMFRAVGKAFGPQNTIAILMTGIGHDGAESMLELKNGGAYTIAESEETAVVYGMPRAAYERGGVCEALPLHCIADAALNHFATR